MNWSKKAGIAALAFLTLAGSAFASPLLQPQTISKQKAIQINQKKDVKKKAEILSLDAKLYDGNKTNGEVKNIEIYKVKAGGKPTVITARTQTIFNSLINQAHGKGYTFEAHVDGVEAKAKKKAPKAKSKRPAPTKVAHSKISKNIEFTIHAPDSPAKKRNVGFIQIGDYAKGVADSKSNKIEIDARSAAEELGSYLEEDHKGFSKIIPEVNFTYSVLKLRKQGTSYLLTGWKKQIKQDANGYTKSEFKHNLTNAQAKKVRGLLENIIAGDSVWSPNENQRGFEYQDNGKINKESLKKIRARKASIEQYRKGEITAEQLLATGFKPEKFSAEYNKWLSEFEVKKIVDLNKIVNEGIRDATQVKIPAAIEALGYTGKDAVRNFRFDKAKFGYLAEKLDHRINGFNVRSNNNSNVPKGTGRVNRRLMGDYKATKIWKTVVAGYNTRKANLDGWKVLDDGKIKASEIKKPADVANLMTLWQAKNPRELRKTLNHFVNYTQRKGSVFDGLGRFGKSVVRNVLRGPEDFYNNNKILVHWIGKKPVRVNTYNPITMKTDTVYRTPTLRHGLQALANDAIFANLVIKYNAGRSVSHPITKLGAPVDDLVGNNLYNKDGALQNFKNGEIGKGIANTAGAIWRSTYKKPNTIHEDTPTPIEPENIRPIDNPGDTFGDAYGARGN
ncbi:MAG: hypothetical protein U9R08_06390 [Nanoarchaeota archaeon]|nr:hypothetical protein [Nanoarchaeota archaeon]